ETGFNLAFPQGVDVPQNYQLNFPTLVRAGVLNPVELRVGTALLGIGRSGPGTSTDVGAVDTILGMKTQFASNHGWVPDAAFSFDIGLPTGDDAFSAGTATVDGRFLFSWALGEGFVLLTNLGAATTPVGERRLVEEVHVINLGFGPEWLDRRVGVFVEHFGKVLLQEPSASADEDRVRAMQADWGAWWMITPDFQVDFFFQNELRGSGGTPLQASVGLSGRIR
ncbi:MAG: transporter, partial [Myxococcota bacterium]